MSEGGEFQQRILYEIKIFRVNFPFSHFALNGIIESISEYSNDVKRFYEVYVFKVCSNDRSACYFYACSICSCRYYLMRKGINED